MACIPLCFVPSYTVIPGTALFSSFFQTTLLFCQKFKRNRFAACWKKSVSILWHLSSNKILMLVTIEFMNSKPLKTKWANILKQYKKSKAPHHVFSSVRIIVARFPVGKKCALKHRFLKITIQNPNFNIYISCFIIFIWNCETFMAFD